MGRRGGAKGVAQIPLDASLSSTIRRHSGLYPSSDEEGNAALIPTSYRQFIPTATSTTSVVTTASGSSDSDTSSSISSTGTVQRRPHLPTSSLAKDDATRDRTPDREAVVRSEGSVSERFKQPPPPPPPAKPERQQQRPGSAQGNKEVVAVAEPSESSLEDRGLLPEGTSEPAAPTGLDDIVDSTNVLNDIGNMLAGLTEELDAMLDLNIDEDEDEKKSDDNGKPRETVIN